MALVAYLEYAPQPDVLATLDLSSVELSFSEKVEETATAMTMPPTPPAKPLARPKAEQSSVPQMEKTVPRPPDPTAPKFREPVESPEKFETEEARRETKDARREDALRETESERRETTERKPAAAAPQQARIDAPPQPRRSIRPEYPKGARQRGEQGDVTLEIRVSAEGAVDRVEVVASSGFAELDAAAVKAAKKAKFAPAKSGRDAVASTARLKLSFKLR